MQTDALEMNWHQEVVLQHALLDGQEVSTHRFRSVQRPEEVMASLRARWRARGVHYVESSHGPWSVLSMREGTTITTVQVKASPGGAEGMSSRWQHRAPGAAPASTAAAEAGLRTLVPQGGRLLRQVTHQDPGRVALTWVVLTDDRPSMAAARLRARAERVGFKVQPGMAEQVVAMRRGREEVVATMTAHPSGSAMVLYWSES